MRPIRIVLSAVLLVLALVLQVSVLGRLQLPGATPDLLMLVVVGLGLVYGPTGGCLVGFAAGLLADLAPPSDHAVGRYALVLCLVGYGAGLLKPEAGRQRSAFSALAVVAVAAVVSTLLYATVGALVGDTAARHVGLTGLVFSALLYDVLLAPFTVPLVMLLARRFDGDRVVNETVRGADGGSGLGSLARYRTTREPSPGPYKKKRTLGLAKRP
ncbi:rod shape-determining protein MreD [Kitasatospora sp. NPDC088134]|uniref:rod shape-determining protein MreD n=1 Tax=Kitasatospora sp. NPDC088134 TaxID=3364071 RepID=UPI003808BFAD